MKLRIENFPHAHFDVGNNRGYLCHYYGFRSIDECLWRASYSPEILDFKEGSDIAIDKFVKPFLELIQFTMQQCNKNSGILIPVPSSVSKNDPAYSSIPYDKAKMPKRKNRDDRCELFCNRIAKLSNNKLLSSSLIERAKSKGEKTHRDVTDQLNSLKFNLEKFQEIEHPDSKLFILIDDVETTGNTFNVCISLMQKNAENVKVVCLAIAKTNSQSEYQPLHMLTED